MKRIVAGLIGAGLAAYGGTVAYIQHFDHQGGPTLSADSPTLKDPAAKAAFDVLREARCDYCHTKGADLPFYFHLPVASTLMQRDLEQGLRHFRMEPVIAAFQKGDSPTEEQLSRIEEVITQNRMPPSLYLLIHWHAHLNEGQRKAVLTWIDTERRAHYAGNGVAAKFAGEPVQPIPESWPVNTDKVALGEKLFFDKRLSGDNTLNCASCHGLDKGGVDNLVTATGIGGQKGPINVPTVYNSVYNIVQFWNGRAATLAEQAAGPVMNPVEMGSHDWKDVATKIMNDPDYGAQFATLYPDQPIGKDTITDAIAEYEKTLITPDSKFDLYLKGDDKALTDQEKHGYALFKSIGCSGCHSGPDMGGGAMEVMGLEHDYFADRGGAFTAADSGREDVTHDPLDKSRFLVPTLRNVALTGPWFHDGSVKTLEDAVRKMAYYQTPDGKISDQDVSDITAFLKTLTGKYKGVPLEQVKATP
ncbi:cytochrome-c peroxidase [Acetobacter aceti NRIC 0242]|uniref:Quinol peroxidase n=1 Tax=Acetobacter aceti NBRC 14818 TaxID=887700 RepID=A0AB33ICN6_ACEAC|nr:cytochrome-c peroxidase [Acetobacter aceti]TCS34826.1 cytochrome c peroxidase [Acetobacter aceti NBRC 14818]BCK74596.1 quinol peroxidase [Acetobacter aceti NBRC 14818]GAN58195.1 cytochrome c peroxidase [Acetobacter aceti NBRC 14818]GBO79875.1 cytochrome-c peroxidase [Acetobacter aceti NRIC 0242]